MQYYNALFNVLELRYSSFTASRTDIFVLDNHILTVRFDCGM
jgi:hypothetical protein